MQLKIGGRAGLVDQRFSLDYMPNHKFSRTVCKKAASYLLAMLATVF